MPMYLIEEEGKKKGVVKALSSSAAIRAATADRFTATNIKTAEEYADLIAEGVPLIVEKPAGNADAGDAQGEEQQQAEQQPAEPPVGDDDTAPQNDADLKQEGADA